MELLDVSRRQEARLSIPEQPECEASAAQRIAGRQVVLPQHPQLMNSTSTL